MADWSLQTLTGSFNDTTPAKTITATANIDLAAMDLNGAMLQLKVTWGASGDGNATVKWYYSADGGTTVSLEQTDTLTPVAPGSKIVSFRAMNQPFVRVTVLNGNTAVEDITLVLKAAGLRFGVFAS
jgi:hypothetical protein